MLRVTEHARVHVLSAAHEGLEKAGDARSDVLEERLVERGGQVAIHERPRSGNNEAAVDALNVTQHPQVIDDCTHDGPVNGAGPSVLESEQLAKGARIDGGVRFEGNYLPVVLQHDEAAVVLERALHRREFLEPELIADEP